MVALDTYQGNLCLWCCKAVHRGARPDRSIQAAQEPAKSFYKPKTAPKDCPKTLLDELDKAEKYLSQGKCLTEWLAIRVYEPERKNEDVTWHLRWNPFG